MEHESTHAVAAAADHESSSGHGVGHVVPVWLLAVVLITLLILTVITVAATLVNFGRLSIWIAMLIATVKASLVVLYFMHLRYDSPFNAVVFIASLLFVALFVGFAAIDTHQYQPVVNWVDAPAVQRAP
jgi:cytochrome c oxidase subunit 4